MCYTQAALELARVTLVGKDEEVLLDELVLPNTPIVHYNTAYSGQSLSIAMLPAILPASDVAMANSVLVAFHLCKSTIVHCQR